MSSGNLHPRRATSCSCRLSPFHLLSAPGEARPSQAPREFGLLPRAPEAGKTERGGQDRRKAEEGWAGDTLLQAASWPPLPRVMEVRPKASATPGACPREGLGEEQPFDALPGLTAQPPLPPVQRKWASVPLTGQALATPQLRPLRVTDCCREPHLGLSGAVIKSRCAQKPRCPVSAITPASPSSSGMFLPLLPRHLTPWPSWFGFSL